MREAGWLRRSRPPHVLSLLGGILALAAAMGIGRFAYTPLLPAMQEAAGLDPTQAGLLAATNYAGYLAGALLAAVAVPASARVRILLVSAIAVAATTGLMAVTTDLAPWSAVRFVAGLASAGVLVLATGLVLDDLRRQGRTSLSGWLFSGVGLGIVVSGVVVRLTGETLGWRGDWLLLALLATTAIYPVWKWLPPTGRERVPPSTLPPASTRPAPGSDAVPIAYMLLFAAYFLEGIGYIVTGTFLVAIVDSTPGLQGIGADVWIVVGLAVIPSAVLWAMLAGRAGYARALTGAYLLQAVGIALPIAGGVGAAFASAVLFGGTFAGITALTLTLGGHLETSRSARLIGMLTAIFSLGQMIGPVLGGVIAHRAQNFAPALVAAAICVLVGGVLMAFLQPFDPLRRGSQTSERNRDQCGRAHAVGLHHDDVRPKGDGNDGARPGSEEESAARLYVRPLRGDRHPRRRARCLHRQLAEPGIVRAAAGDALRRERQFHLASHPRQRPICDLSPRRTPKGAGGGAGSSQSARRR